jgi:hypothetical protein
MPSGMRSRASITVLSATVTAAELAQLIGVTPDRVLERGTAVRGSAGGVHRFSVAAYESCLEPNRPPSEHLDDLLTRLSPAQDALRVLAGEPHAGGGGGAAVRLHLFVEAETGTAALDIAPAQLAAIGLFGAQFAVTVTVQTA